MSDWHIRYRSATGPTDMAVRADTQEAAEVFFYDIMLDGDTFGSIITIHAAETLPPVS